MNDQVSLFNPTPPNQSPLDRAIARMRSPSEMHIICIDITNRCDLKCSNCTRLLAQQPERWDMTPRNFRMAVRSLADFPGVIAVIGGNPCLHRQFPLLCNILEEEVPDRGRRGLWSNNLMGHEQIIADVFGFFNLNPHADERGMASMERLRALMPNIHRYSGASRHSPILAAIMDVAETEEAGWDAISRCDINRNWSATITQNGGSLRAYFCEVAAAFDLARGQDHGAEVREGWWKRPLVDFTHQIKASCPGCGIPARLPARLDHEETDDYSATNARLARISTRGRKMLDWTNEKFNLGLNVGRPATVYNDAEASEVVTPVISVVIPYRNAQDTIVETIDSVLTQNATVEIIVSDDGSADYFEFPPHQQPFVRSLSAHPCTGPAAARNRGLRVARAPFICFLDADDCYAPGFFGEALRAFEANPSMAAILCDIELVNAHREVHPVQLQAITMSLPSNIIVRRAVAEAVGGFPEDEAFRGPNAGEDVAFKQIIMENFQGGMLNMPGLRYRCRRGSHFDYFLDSSEVVDGQLRFTRAPEEDVSGARPAALARYRAAFRDRMRTIDACKRGEWK